MRFGLINYALRRIILIIPVLIGVSFISFSLIHLSPGGVLDALTGTGGTALPPEYVEEIKQAYHLDEPWYMQYLYWLSSVVQGDLGYTYMAKRPVADHIASRIVPTLQVGGLAILFSMLISLPAGILSAVYKDTWIDETSRFVSFGGVSIPRFWLGLMLILVLGQYWNQWFGYGLISTGGYVSLSDAGFIEFMHHMAAPAVCIGFGFAAITTRITRSSMLEELNKDYVTTARSKGLREQAVISVHVVRNALIPVVTVVGMQIGFVFNGIVVIEEVFAIPGIGRLLFRTVANQDYPVVQALLMMIATVFVLANLAVDILYAYLDPRIVYEGEA